jgi:hypothetical protein
MSIVQASTDLQIIPSQYATWTSVKQLKPEHIVQVLNMKRIDVLQSLEILLGDGKVKNTRVNVKGNLEQVWKYNKIGISETGRNPRL